MIFDDFCRHFFTGKGNKFWIQLAHVNSAQLGVGTPQVQLDVKDSTGRTALHCAASRGSQLVTRMLLDTWDVEKKYREGNEIFELLQQFAKYYNRWKILQ